MKQKKDGPHNRVISQAGNKGICEGDRAIYEPVRRVMSRFAQERKGMECIVVSCNSRAVIVEIPSLKELLLCKMKDLKPAGRAIEGR
jgi:hypothetical protein